MPHRLPPDTPSEYPEPRLQQTRGSPSQSSPKISAPKKKQSPRHGGEMAQKRTESKNFLDSAFFFNAGKNRVQEIPGLHSSLSHLSPMSGTLPPFRAETLGPLQDKPPPACWSQGSGYSPRASKGSLHGIRPDQTPPKCWRWSNLLYTVLQP